MPGRLDQQDVILASGSVARRDMLTAAGIKFRVVPADVDEAAIRETLAAGDARIEPADIAEVLAVAKAEAVSRDNHGALVIGADQVLAFGSEIINKARGADDARTTLMKLRGQRHQLHSAVAIALDGEVDWTATDTAELTMRKFSPRFLEDYLLLESAHVCQSVGAYRIEGPGIQLFEKIEGDHFTILGLPLLALLEELRARGVTAE